MVLKRTVIVRTLVWVLASAATSCSSPTAAEEDLAAGNGVALQGGSTLLFQNAGRLDAHRAAIERVVRETVAAARTLIPVDASTIIARAGTDLVIPEIGIGGRADGGTVQLAFDPEFPALAASIERELRPLLAHELHHVARMRSVGYGNHLLGAMVSEGLADQFAVEFAAVPPPPWSTALDGELLEMWFDRARAVWLQPGYDHDAWFFGGNGIPRWAGYSIGFAMTGDYLARHPDQSAASLYREPAASFIGTDGAP